MEVTPRTDGSLLVDAGLSTRLVVPAGGPVVPQQDPNDDGYPDVVLDIPRAYSKFVEVTGKSYDETTLDDVFTYWDRSLAARKTMGSLGPEPVVPYINQSRWVADCVCNGGMLCWPKIPYTACLNCGRLYAVLWQIPAVRSEVIRVLAVREPEHRNWDPRRTDKSGAQVETVEFLRRENLLMLGV